MQVSTKEIADWPEPAKQVEEEGKGHFFGRMKLTLVETCDLPLTKEDQTGEESKCLAHSKVPGFSIAAVKEAHSGGILTVGAPATGARCKAHNRKKSAGS